MTMPRPKPGDLLGLVDVDKGIVSREIFVNEEIYRQEQERMFARAWLFVGHESQITRPGDYLVSSMGEESVILCRDRAERIHVFLTIGCRCGATSRTTRPSESSPAREPMSTGSMRARRLSPAACSRS